MWHICMTEGQSVTETDEVLIDTTAWMNLENIMLSERLQPQKDYILHDYISMKCQEQGNLSVDRKQISSCLGLE